LVARGTDRRGRTPSFSIAQDERRIGAEQATVQRLRDGHEVELSEDHERGALVDGEFDRANRVLDNRLAIGRRPEDAGTEAVQRGLVADVVGHASPQSSSGTPSLFPRASGNRPRR